jgi:hypothetical protein
MRRMWPWRSKCNSFMWLGTLLEKPTATTGSGSKSPLLTGSH